MARVQKSLLLDYSREANGDLSVLGNVATTVTLAQENYNKKLPTNLTTWKHPVHRWYNFIAGYSPEFVTQCIAASQLTSNDCVLDPFSGCGTTLVVASGNGLPFVGYEAHPFFYRIANAKTSHDYTSTDLELIEKAILKGLECLPSKEYISVDAWTFLRKLFDERILMALLGARKELEDTGLADKDITFLIMSRLIDECSFAQTDGIYKAPTSRKRALEPSVAIRNIISQIKSDNLDSNVLTNGKIYNCSSEIMSDVESESVSLIVTSPPYHNNFDYAEMTRMHLYFWGMATSWGDITKKIRKTLIVNTTTALKGHRDNQKTYMSEIAPDVLEEIQEISSQLAEIKKNRRGKKDYDLLLLPYMAQISRVYKECHRVMKNGAICHTMIADSAFYGVHTPSPQWLAKSLEWIGFTDVQCIFVRARGHRWILAKREGSSQGLGEYHIIARK